MRTDALDRRSRFAKPQPIDTRIILTARDTAILRAVARHGHLPTHYLYALTKHTGRLSYRFFQQRLTMLFNGYCDHPDHRSKNPDGHTCKAKHFLDRHPDQFDNFYARSHDIVHQLAPLGAKLLLDEGQLPHPFKRSNSFVHDLFLGCFTASIEIIAPRFIFRDDILKHPKCPTIQGYPFTFANFVPDDIFGIRDAHEDPNKGFSFFVLEIDRATERIDTLKPLGENSSIAKKIRYNIQALETQEYRSRYGLPNVSFLYATTSVSHADGIVRFMEQAVPSSYRDRFLIKAFPLFGENWRVPQGPLDVLNSWRTASGVKHLSKKAPTEVGAF